jgi:hypothetical protein
VTHRAAPYQQEQQQQQQQQQPKPQQPQQQPSDEQTVEQFLEQFDISLIEGAKLLVESKSLSAAFFTKAMFHLVFLIV